MAGSFLAIMIVYHNLQGRLQGWIRKKDSTDEVAQALYKSLRTLLLFTTITTTLVLTLNLLGLFYPLQKIISFPMLMIGDTPISMWTLSKVAIILIGFVFVSKLLRSYLDYKIYPTLKIDEGLGYSLNILVGYLFIGIGILFSLRLVGLDLRVFMVFAGAIGIGIGFGLQNMAANLISGLSLIFGRKIRKGDWIQIGDTLGHVKEVTLRVTRVRTRDNIEYLVPNAELTSGTIVNYTLSDPEIRIHVPVGVSYDSKPHEIVNILETAAHGNENLSKVRKPKVWFVEYGDNSLNFELLVWIDVRRVSEREVRSRLYFEIFNALEEAGIEIPFPQRDIHIRSGFTWPDFKDNK
ncbi:MAG: mechanosensitive ion channel [Deltaproteobacteria bacterium]|nr:mechanosensitive ion channel [Deltaproteobacteria bacterium]